MIVISGIVFLAVFLVAILKNRYLAKPFKAIHRLSFDSDSNLNPEFAILEIKNLAESDESIESAGFVEQFWRRDPSKNSNNLITAALESPSLSSYNQFPIKIPAKCSANLKLNFKELANNHSICGLYYDIQVPEPEVKNKVIKNLLKVGDINLNPDEKCRVIYKNKLLKKYSKKYLAMNFLSSFSSDFL